MNKVKLETINYKAKILHPLSFKKWAFSVEFVRKYKVNKNSSKKLKFIHCFFKKSTKLDILWLGSYTNQQDNSIFPQIQEDLAMDLLHGILQVNVHLWLLDSVNIE